MKQLTKNNFFLFKVLPFVLGLLTSFSLPPYNLIFINFFTFPLLLLIIFELKKLQKKINFFFKVGWLFGFGYFLSNLYWITYSLTHDDNFKIIIPFALILVPAFLAIFYGLVVLLLFKVNINKRLTTIIIFSLIFSIIEFLRGNILSGFPWNLISFSWIFSISSLQILSLVGTYVFNLISITLFSLPIVFVFKNYKRVQINVAIFLLLLISINYFYGYQKIKSENKVELENYNYIIKILSPKISIDRYVRNFDEKKILIELIELSNPIENLPTIFVWPEGVLPGIYFDELEKYKNLFSNNFSRNHIIIMGINTSSFESGSEKIYNSMIVIDNNLKLIAKYDKNNLVPFGEFFPFEKYFKKVGLKKITHGYQSFSNSQNREVISIKNENFKINFLPLICYEIIYSGKINVKKKEIDFIVNISEDGWFGDSIGPYQHFSHSIFRAIEEGKNIIRSANNGISSYVSGSGAVINKIKSTQKGVIEIKKFKTRKKTLFSKVGNKMFFYFVLIYIILIFFFNKWES